MHNSIIREVNSKDLKALKEVIDSNDLFPSELLEEMMADYFTNPSSEAIWLTLEINSTPIAISYCAPERMTEGTYNQYLLAIHRDYQGKGLGSELMNFIEDLVGAKGGRVLLVETSGLPEFERTRMFYETCKYTREAVIRDFYREGDDKIVFWKKLRTIDDD